MQTILREIAAWVEGELVGDGDLTITGAATLNRAKPGEITLVDRVERKSHLKKSQASAVVVPRDMELDQPLPIIRVDDVHRAFATIVAQFRPPRIVPRLGVSSQAVVHPSASLGRDVDIHPLASIGEDVEIGDGSTIHSGVQIMPGSKIGQNVTIFPNVVIYENTRIGDRCILHGGVVVGGYGFGYDSTSGRHLLSAQLGHVEIGDDVEIGANSTVDRGTYGPTTIGNGTKIDNLVIVAHNCSIGRHNMICAFVGIAGSVSTGDHVVMAGQVGIRDHVTIGAGAMMGAMSGVINDVPEGARMLGIPATPEREQWVKLSALAKLPKMRQQMKRLQAEVDKLSNQSEGLGVRDEGLGVETG